MRVSIRDEKAVINVIDLCTSLEEQALGIYTTLMGLAENKRMHDLWATMVADEKEHQLYWKRLKEVCSEGAVPEVFDEPRRYVDELEALQLRVDHIAGNVKEDFRAPGVFIHALRLEFLLLHPSFVTLFHYLPDSPGVVSPSRTYEQHLGKLLNALMDYEALPPEMELLGEAIGQVWRKSEEGVTKTVTDTLTGTLNRRGLYIAMKPLAYLARRERETAGVMIMEITNLKEINDLAGHKQGDRILEKAAKIISSRLRSSDVVGRFGGDDFLALLTRFDSGHFEKIGENLVKKVGEAVEGSVGASLSIGGAYAEMKGEVEAQLEELIRAADKALDEARKDGKSCVVKALSSSSS